MPRALLEGRGDGAFIRLGDAMTATPEQHVHNFFAAHGKLGGAFLCANGAPCMVMDARMLRALDVQTKAMGQYIAQCGDDADPTRADTLVNMIAAEGLRVDLLAAVPGSALLEDTHGFSGLAIFDIDVHDNSPAGSVSFTLGGAAIAATLANERDAAADAMEAAPWASCDAYGGTQFNSVTIRRWASVKYIHVPKYYHISLLVSSWPPCVPTAPSTNKQLLSSPPRRAYQYMCPHSSTRCSAARTRPRLPRIPTDAPGAELAIPGGATDIRVHSPERRGAPRRLAQMRVLYHSWRARGCRKRLAAQSRGSAMT